MKLRDIYAREGLTLSIEFFPPKTEESTEALFREVEVLKTLHPAFCSVTYGAGGSTHEKTVDLVRRLRDDHALDVMCHLTVVGQSRDEVRTVLERLEQYGIENIIALAGDPPRESRTGLPHPERVSSLPGARRGGSRPWDVLDRRRRVSGGPSPGGEPGGRHSLPQGEGRRRRRRGDHAALLRQRRLLPLRGGRTTGWRRDTDRPRGSCRSSPSRRRVASQRCAARGSRRDSSRCSPLSRATTRPQRSSGSSTRSEQCEGLLAFGVPGIHFYSLNRSRSVKAIVENLSLPAVAAAQ